MTLPADAIRRPRPYLPARAASHLGRRLSKYGSLKSTNLARSSVMVTWLKLMSQ
jgi:hypothetical protein